MTRNSLKDDVNSKYEGTFSVRVIDHWNSLPQEVIKSGSRSCYVGDLVYKVEFVKVKNAEYWVRNIYVE